jgi:NAD(P)-dependent dehydrogenase (short-subunit alcohol dehydrogenase family)
MVLQGKTAVVTGGARGVGHAYCRRLAADGANVVVVNRSDPTESLAKLSGPGKKMGLTCDVSQPDQVEAVRRQVIDRFDRGPHLHFLLGRRAALQRPTESGATHLRQLTHPLDAETALQRHHFLDLVVDAFAPEDPLCWRRASTFCKAPLKKSTSSVLSTSSRWS